jgi:hypothetical protein
MPRRIEHHALVECQLEIKQYDASTASLMSGPFVVARDSDAVAPCVTMAPYDAFNDDLSIEELDDVGACFVGVHQAERSKSGAGCNNDDDGVLADQLPAREHIENQNKLMFNELAATDERLDKEIDWHRQEMAAKQEIIVSLQSTCMASQRQAHQLSNLVLQLQQQHDTATREEEPTCTQHAPGRDSNVIGTIRSDTEGLIMLEVDTTTMGEAVGLQADTDHGYGDDNDGFLADKMTRAPPPAVALENPRSSRSDVAIDVPVPDVGVSHLVCGGLKPVRHVPKRLIDLKRFGSVADVQNSWAPDTDRPLAWRRQRPLRPLRRSVVLRHATSIARIRENAAYGLAHYPHP